MLSVRLMQLFVPLNAAQFVISIMSISQFMQMFYPHQFKTRYEMQPMKMSSGKHCYKEEMPKGYNWLRDVVQYLNGSNCTNLQTLIGPFLSAANEACPAVAIFQPKKTWKQWLFQLFRILDKSRCTEMELKVGGIFYAAKTKCPTSAMFVNDAHLRHKHCLVWTKHDIEHVTQSLKCSLCMNFVQTLHHPYANAAEVLADGYNQCQQTGFFTETCSAVVRQHHQAAWENIHNATSLDKLKSVCHSLGTCSKEQTDAYPGNKTISLKVRPSRYFILDPAVAPILGPLTLTQVEFQNFEDVSNHFGETTEDIMVSLARYQLLKNSRDCPNNCAPGRMSLVKDKTLPDGFIWRCGPCKRQPGIQEISISVRAESFFSGSHLSLKQVLHLSWIWATHPTQSLDQIIAMMGNEQVSKNTVLDKYNLFRDVCQQWLSDNQAVLKLGGPGTVVEIDESQFFKAKYNRGHALDRPAVWVFGMIERGTNKVRLAEVEDRRARTLIPIIEQHVEDGTMIISDGWAAYGGYVALNAYARHNYGHVWVNHRINFVDPANPLVHTQSMEATWGAIKRGLKHLCGTSDRLFPTYLFQYMFRRAHGHKKVFQNLWYWVSFQYPV